jgi:hypothetical protein
MTRLSRLMIGTAGLAATLALASPAAAQQPYPYNNQGTGVLGAIVNAVTGNSYNQYPQGAYGYGQYPQGAYDQYPQGAYGQYPQGAYGYGQYPHVAYSYGQYPQGNYGYGQTNQRAAVGMCAAAAEQRISATYRGQSGYGYNGSYPGSANGYNGQIGRVLGITNVEPRYNGSLKVSGIASSGRGYGYYGQGYSNGYNGQNAYVNQAADLRFTCKVNTLGQVTGVDINRNQVAYRGY